MMLRHCLERLIGWLTPGIEFEFAEFEPPQGSAQPLNDPDE